jgi:hypothetical protein
LQCVVRRPDEPYIGAAGPLARAKLDRR